MSNYLKLLVLGVIIGGAAAVALNHLIGDDYFYHYDYEYYYFSLNESNASQPEVGPPNSPISAGAKTSAVSTEADAPMAEVDRDDHILDDERYLPWELHFVDGLPVAPPKVPAVEVPAIKASVIVDTAEASAESPNDTPTGPADASDSEGDEVAAIGEVLSDSVAQMATSWVAVPALHTAQLERLVPDHPLLHHLKDEVPPRDHA